MCVCCCCCFCVPYAISHRFLFWCCRSVAVAENQESITFFLPTVPTSLLLLWGFFSYGYDGTCVLACTCASCRIPDEIYCSSHSLSLRAQKERKQQMNKRKINLNQSLHFVRNATRHVTPTHTTIYHIITSLAQKWRWTSSIFKFNKIQFHFTQRVCVCEELQEMETCHTMRGESIWHSISSVEFNAKSYLFLKVSSILQRHFPFSSRLVSSRLDSTRVLSLMSRGLGHTLVGAVMVREGWQIVGQSRAEIRSALSLPLFSLECFLAPWSSFHLSK